MVQLLEEDREDFVVKLSELKKLEDVGIEDANLARRGLDQAHLLSLVLSDARQWPPILVTKTNQGYVIVDGYHRFAAAPDKQLDEIRVTCKTFKSEQDLIQACFEANMRHGLPLNETKRSDYARWLHKAYPKMTQTEIGRICHLTQPSVSAAIAREEAKEVTAAKPAEEAKPVKEVKPVKGEAAAPQPAEAAPPSEEEKRREEIRKTCERLTHDVVELSQEIEGLDETEQRRALIRAISPDSIQERDRLLKIARLIEQILSAQPTTAPPPKRSAKR